MINAVTIARLVLTISAIGSIVACSGIDTEATPNAATESQVAPPDPSLDVFLQEVALEYEALAASEEERRDWSEFDLFGNKAIQARSGVLVFPSKVGDRAIPERSLPELANAENRLSSVFERGGREISGITSARAQTFFDCWLREAEEDFQPADIAACRSGFFETISQLEASVDRTLVVLLPGDSAGAVTANLGGQTSTLDQPYQALSGNNDGVDDVALSEQAVGRLFSDELSGEPLPPATFILTFESGGSELTREGQRQLENALDEIERRESADVSVVGHTDTVGPASLNVRLARSRAGAVERLLRAEQVDAKYLSVDSFGESDPIVPTGDNVDEERNRRVEIVVR